MTKGENKPQITRSTIGNVSDTNNAHCLAHVKGRVLKVINIL